MLKSSRRAATDRKNHLVKNVESGKAAEQAAEIADEFHFASPPFYIGHRLPRAKRSAPLTQLLVRFPLTPLIGGGQRFLDSALLFVVQRECYRTISTHLFVAS